MPKKEKKTKVRKPVEDSTPPEPEEEEDEYEPEVEPEPPKPAVKATPAKEPPKSVPAPKAAIPRARVVLTGAASLRRQGRVFVKDRPFMVDGDEAIDFFKHDKRFLVTLV